jgi:hypothetical protein
MKIMRIITSQEFIDAVHTVLDKRGDGFVYQAPVGVEYEDSGTCVYSEDEGQTGSCLFGAALIEELGVPYDASWEGATIAQILRGEAGSEDVDFDFDYTLDLCRAAYEAQRSQDISYEYSRVRAEFDGILAGTWKD